MNKYTRYLTFILIIGFSLIPLFFSLPFRIHLDVSWEGTYRLYLGQVPYKDFGMPIGYGFFIFPLLAFYVFGPTLKALLISQAIVNIITTFTFRAIVKKLGLNEERSLIAILVFLLSYSFMYFWPWYNFTAIMFELIGLYFLLLLSNSESAKRNYMYLAGSAFFIFLTFFTKQDYGGLAFTFALIIIAYISWLKKRWIFLPAFILFYAVSVALIILPFISTDFSYWFNVGQPPHNSRIYLYSIFEVIMLDSQWEKFYLVVLAAVLIKKFSTGTFDMRDSKFIISFLMVSGMIMEALITKSTSGNSLENTTYFHAFGIAFLLVQLPDDFIPQKIRWIIPAMFVVFIWWSGEYWKYAGRIFNFSKPVMRGKTLLDASFQSSWRSSDLKAFKGIKLPSETINGLERVQSLSLFKSQKELKVLNMTELTPLALEWNYTPMKGLPLWYHQGVSIFPKQIDEICASIANKEFDLVMFETIPSLTNFFPNDLRNCLIDHYKLKDKFIAPRKEGDSFIEVYVLPESD